MIKCRQAVIDDAWRGKNMHRVQHLAELAARLQNMLDSLIGTELLHFLV